METLKLDRTTRMEYCQCAEGAGRGLFCSAGVIWRVNPEYPEHPACDFWVRACPAFVDKMRRGDELAAALLDAEERHATFHDTQLPMIRGEIDELKDQARAIKTWVRRSRGWPDRDGTEYGREVGPW